MNQSHIRTIQNLLYKLGLIQSEIIIFLLGLEMGAVSIKQLAEQSEMNRVTVHEIVKRLISKGLFLQTYSKHKRLVYPNQLNALEQLVQRKKLEVTQLEQDVAQAASVLRAIQAESESFPSTRFYKGQEGIQIMVREIMQDKQHIAIMSDGQHFYDLIDNNLLEKSLQLRQKHKLTVQLLFPPGFEYFCYTQGTYQQQLQIKSLPNPDQLRGGMTIRGDKVALHCYEGHFITTTLIDNAYISQMMGYMYQSMWSGAKNY